MLIQPWFYLKKKRPDVGPFSKILCPDMGYPGSEMELKYSLWFVREKNHYQEADCIVSGRIETVCAVTGTPLLFSQRKTAMIFPNFLLPKMKKGIAELAKPGGEVKAGWKLQWFLVDKVRWDTAITFPLHTIQACCLAQIYEQINNLTLLPGSGTIKISSF